MLTQPSFRIAVQADFAPAMRYLNKLPFDLQDKAVARALNDLGSQAKTKARSQIVSEYNLTRADVDRFLFFNRASWKHGQLTVVVGAASPRGRALQMIRFVQGSATKGQRLRALSRAGIKGKKDKAAALDRIFVRVKRKGGLKLLGKPGWAQSLPFVMTNRKTGGTFVAARASEARGDVRSVMTIGVPQMFSTKRSEAVLLALIREKFPTLLRSKVDAMLRGY